jgi:hypothetical protein
MSHWKKQWHATDLKPKDEIFWHATTFANVKKIHGSAEGIKPEFGGGQNGKGFYVCPRCTDYGKVMAYRNRQEGDPKELFILKILVEGFYDMKPLLSDGFAGFIDADVCDFVGSRWDPKVIGPSENSKPEGGGTTGKGRYDAYQGEVFKTPGYDLTKGKLVKDKDGKEVTEGKQDYVGGKKVKGFKARGDRRKRAQDALWEAAKANQAPVGGTGSKKMDLLIQSLGPRKAFLYSLEELTFKKQTGPKISVVGARKFYAASPDDQLVNWFDNDTEIELEEVEKIIGVAK